MTVKELKEYLDKLPDDMKIYECNAQFIPECKKCKRLLTHGEIRYLQGSCETCIAKNYKKESNVKDENACIRMADMPICKACNNYLTIVSKQDGWGKCTNCDSTWFL